MIKHKWFLASLLFVFSLLISNVNQASAQNLPEGCTVNTRYSPTTGQFCSSLTIVNPSNALTRDLRIGSRGSDVKILQTFLKEEGYYFGKIDGAYGARTARAVRELQEDSELPIMGIVDAATRAVVNSGGVTVPTPLPTPGSPVISGVSGPQSLNVNQQGTWAITASSPNGGNLSYSVDWGEGNDNPYRGLSLNSLTQQSATFTHSYSSAGIRTVTFEVTNNSGQSAQTSLSVNVGNVTNTSSLTVLSPNGGETWTKETTQTIRWQDYSTTPCQVGSVCGPTTYDITLNEYFPPCTENVCPMSFRGPLTYIIAKSISGSFYNWLIGDVWDKGIGPIDSAYTVQICKTGSSICDSSDSYFKIVSGVATNAQPAIGPVAVPSNISVGQSVNFNFSATDADNDDLSWSVDWGDGGSGGSCQTPNPQQKRNWTYSTSHTWNTAGAYLVKVNVSDCRGGTTPTSFSVDVGGTTTTPVPAIYSILPPGCTVNKGYSSTSGESCATPRSSANFGDTVYVYGSGFGDNYYDYGIYAATYSSSSGDLVAMPATIISSSLLSFVVPSYAGTGVHGIFLKKAINDSFVSNTVSLNFISSSSSSLVITTSSPLPNAKVGNAYSAVVEASGGSGSYYWNLVSGSLPSGISFIGGVCPTGSSPCRPPANVSGIPTQAGTYAFTLQVISNPIAGDGPSQYASKQFTLTVDQSPISSKPDITISGVTCNPASPKAYEWIYCDVTVYNNSPVNITQSFDINIQGTAVRVNAPLNAWEKRSVMSPSGFGLSILGKNELNFPVDIWNSVDESNENNNTFTMYIYVSGDTTSSVTVLSPNGGETWTKGTTQTIKWSNVTCTSEICNDSLSKYHDIKLISYNDCRADVCAAWYSQERTIAQNVYGNSFSWTIPNCTSEKPCSSNFEIAEGAYTVQVCETGTSICDSSDSYFKIVSSNFISDFNITTNSPLTSGTVGQKYSASLDLGNAPSGFLYNWSLYSGSLPPGLNLQTSSCTLSTVTCDNTKTAQITGIPTTAGTYIFAVYAGAGDYFTNKQFTLTVYSAPFGFNLKENMLLGNVLSAVEPASGNPTANVQAAASKPFHFTKFLEEGLYGQEVRELQKVLTALGYYSGKIDSAFGPKVKEALIKLQTANKLKADGIFGYEVRTFLNK